MASLLIADSDDVLLNVIGFALRSAGFEVATACNGTEAIGRLERESFSLVILDVDMRGADGFEVLARLRQSSRVPVILLGEPGAEHDALRGLEAGADDYLIKPFATRALVARVHALLRRSGLSTTATAGNTVLDREGLRLDVAGARFQLSPMEASVLGVLMPSAGRYVDTKTLMTEIWGQSGTRERKALKQVIHRLRRKLNRNATASASLETARGLGYCWQVGRRAPDPDGAFTGMVHQGAARLQRRSPPARTVGDEVSGDEAGRVRKQPVIRTYEGGVTVGVTPQTLQLRDVAWRGFEPSTRKALR